MMIIKKCLAKLIEILKQKYAEFRVNNSGKVYFTFDDGPEPNITEFVLRQLKKYNAKATFFCTGENIIKYRELYSQLIEGGHSIGCHTMTHIEGQKTSFTQYSNEVDKFCNRWKVNLFRPPYRSLSIRQLLYFRKKYRIILWDVDSTDWYDAAPEDFEINEIQKKINPGSIVLCHFCKAHEARTRTILPLLLKYCQDNGWEMDKIS